MTVTDRLQLRTLYSPPHGRPDARFWQWLGKVGRPARQSASSRRTGRLQPENHCCNQVRRSP